MESSLCQICGYSLRLTRRSQESKQNNAQIVQDLLKDPTQVENYLPIDIHSLTNSDAYKKIGRGDRNKLLKLIPESDNIYYHRCKNSECNQVKLLTPGSIIYEEGNDSEDSLEDYTRFAHSKVLAKTSKYKCKNSNCSSHAKPEMREAIFFRTNNSLQLVYMCLVCKHYWKKE